MRKLKIYLDTSVISHLHQDDVPDKMKDTLKLWEEIKQGKYDVFLSMLRLAKYWTALSLNEALKRIEALRREKELVSK